MMKVRAFSDRKDKIKGLVAGGVTHYTLHSHPFSKVKALALSTAFGLNKNGRKQIINPIFWGGEGGWMGCKIFNV